MEERMKLMIKCSSITGLLKALIIESKRNKPVDHIFISIIERRLKEYQDE